jgi:hypothetical protein
MSRTKPRMTKHAHADNSATLHVMMGKTNVHIYTRCGTLLLKSLSRTTFDVGGRNVCLQCQTPEREGYGPKSRRALRAVA